MMSTECIVNAGKFNLNKEKIEFTLYDMLEHRTWTGRIKQQRLILTALESGTSKVQVQVDVSGEHPRPTQSFPSHLMGPGCRELPQFWCIRALIPS